MSPLWPEAEITRPFGLRQQKDVLRTIIVRQSGAQNSGRQLVQIAAAPILKSGFGPSRHAGHRTTLVTNGAKRTCGWLPRSTAMAQMTERTSKTISLMS